MSRRLFAPTVDDLEAILGLMNDPRSVHRQIACRHGERIETANELYDRLMQDDNLALSLDGRLVGYASWQWYGRHAHLNVMSVAGDVQRQGLGQTLFQGFMDVVFAAGGCSISLRAYTDSEWALAFYDKIGMSRYRPGDEETIGDGGLRQYILAALEHGAWPSEDKVMFVGELE